MPSKHELLLLALLDKLVMHYFPVLLQGKCSVKMLKLSCT